MEHASSKYYSIGSHQCHQEIKINQNSDFKRFKLYSQRTWVSVENPMNFLNYQTLKGDISYSIHD